MNCTVNGGNAHIIIAGQFSHRFPGCKAISDLAAFPGIEPWLTAKHGASRFGAFDPFVASGANELTLEFGHAAHDGQN